MGEANALNLYTVGYIVGGENGVLGCRFYRRSQMVC